MNTKLLAIAIVTFGLLGSTDGNATPYSGGGGWPGPAWAWPGAAVPAQVHPNQINIGAHMRTHPESVPQGRLR